jgi:hypothetical protein
MKDIQAKVIAGPQKALDLRLLMRDALFNFLSA